MLLGAVSAGGGSVIGSARFAFGCLARPVYQRLLTEAGITAVSLIFFFALVL